MGIVANNSAAKNLPKKYPDLLMGALKSISLKPLLWSLKAALLKNAAAIIKPKRVIMLVYIVITKGAFLYTLPTEPPIWILSLTVAPNTKRAMSSKKI